MLEWLPQGAPIPGSYWGEPEAGLIRNRLLLRDDTPLHSALHEASHFICMHEVRRMGLHTDAGGGDLEESAVCYLQLLLADQLSGVGRERLAQDMDAWGYSFRLGSTKAWFEQDADDARCWLIERGLADRAGALIAPASAAVCASATGAKAGKITDPPGETRR